MIGCNAYNSQPCQSWRGVNSTGRVQCCRHCKKYDDCKLMKCKNNTDKCGKIVFDAVKVDSCKKGKRVAKLDAVTGEVLAIYDTVKQASEATGIKCSGSISQVCRGKGVTTGGYKWRYVEDEEIL